MKRSRNLAISLGTSRREIPHVPGFYWWCWLTRAAINKTTDDYLMVFVLYARWLCFDLLVQRIKWEPGFERHFRTNW